LDEDNIIRGGEGSAGLSIKGHYSEENGGLARLLSAKAVEARSTSLNDEFVCFYWAIETRATEIDGYRSERSELYGDSKVYFCG
jgi:hypothetical protein